MGCRGILDVPGAGHKGMEVKRVSGCPWRGHKGIRVHGRGLDALAWRVNGKVGCRGGLWVLQGGSTRGRGGLGSGARGCLGARGVRVGFWFGVQGELWVPRFGVQGGLWVPQFGCRGALGAPGWGQKGSGRLWVPRGGFAVPAFRREGALPSRTERPPGVPGGRPRSVPA